MEVEREREWKATEEEEADFFKNKAEDAADAAEEELGGLQIRQQKKKGIMGRKFDSEDQHSVYLDADQGIWKCWHCTWTYHLSGPGIDLIQKHEGSCQVAMEVETLTQLGTYTHSPIKGADVENGTVEAKESNGHKDVSVEEHNDNLRNAVVENGSNSHLSSDKKSENGFTRNDNEIQEQAEHTQGESSTFVVEEFEVVRVLREQETHDLICPKCRSCITKRVILRKRKRTPSQSGLPPPKAPNVPGASPLPTEPQDPVDTATFGCLDTAVFRCLSCFSFFIPTESGCNILRVFWKRHASDDTQSSENKPARTGNWVTSCFGLDSSQNEDTESGNATEKPGFVVKPPSPRGIPQFNGNSNNSVPPVTGFLPPEHATEKPGFVVKPPPLAGIPQFNGNSNNSVPPVTDFLPPGHATEKPGFVVKSPSMGGIPQFNGNSNNSVPPVTGFLPPGNNIGSSVGVVKPTRPVESTDPNSGGPEISATGDAILDVGMRGPEESPRDNDWDVLKSIVYGGLMESIISLGVVSSAAGTGSSTLNICALGLANLIGGLFVIAHDISELRSAHDAVAANQRDEQAGRYWEKLGQRKHFRRHAFFAILSYIIFGLLPPAVYGFAFRVSDNKEYKVIAVAATSLLCVALLAIGKAHVRPQKDYIISLFYYLGIAVPASGLSYVAGVMIDRLLVELSLFDPSNVSPSPPSSIDLLKFGAAGSAWASI